MILRFLFGLLLSGAIAWAAFRRHSLSRSGGIGAMMTGTIAFTAGVGWAIILILFGLLFRNEAISYAGSAESK